MKRTFRNILFSAYESALTRLNRFFSTTRSRLSLAWQGAEVGPGLRTSGPCHFKLRKAGSIRFGRNVTWEAYFRRVRVGLTGPVILETLDDGVIEVGDDSGGSAVVLSARTRIQIGNHVRLGGNVRIFDHDFHSHDPEKRRGREILTDVKSAPVVIGNDVFIGTSALILKGVTIGDRAIIGAGAVVTRSVPAGEIWAGNPARKRETSKICEL
jgi:acetyltransferase-like isoleucine patch superfamily enzyme